MSAPFMKSAALAVVLALSTLAHAADDAPGVAGRVSLAQGDVTLESAEGGRGAATVNWPVTSGDVLATERGARAEVRIGSTAVRLDGDSSMEVVRLDDDTLRLRLYYGSVNVRVMNRELLQGFELSTPHGAVRMLEPGRFRVDAERAPDTTALHVFEGVAQLTVPGSSLTVRETRSALVQAGDVRTGAAVRDGFDDWAWLRDLRDDRSLSARYVPREMTGYEELDQYGTWRESAEYGPLWIPRAVPVGWVPYRDGRWTYVHPWGWTWVDNAPWGYAPSHYGRWVMVDSRWCWTPGRRVTRPVWAPALVGWIGGSNWSLTFTTFGNRHMPAQGWYPLTPHDVFVPHYRPGRDHLSRINHGVRPPRDRDRWRGRHPHGLTVVPQEHFGRGGIINVRDMPRAAVPTASLPVARVAPPPAPLRRHADRDQRDRSFEDRRGGRYAQGAVPVQPNPQPQLQPQAQPTPQPGQPDRDERRNRRIDRFGDDDGRFSRRGVTPPPFAAQRPATPPVVQAPAPAVQQPQAAEEPPARPGRGFGRRDDDDRGERPAFGDRGGRGDRGERDGPPRQRQDYVPQQQPAPAPVAAPVVQHRPPPQPQVVHQAPPSPPPVAMPPPPRAAEPQGQPDQVRG
ncbi:MAG TPA: DUF6600 domain-containing protein, partial [Telluria sp.]|nr:DUF6600 domain-containing protein [Telluria sp.]